MTKIKTQKICKICKKVSEEAHEYKGEYYCWYHYLIIWGNDKLIEME